MAGDSNFFGRAVREVLTNDRYIHPMEARLYDFDADASGVRAIMPDARYLRQGGPVFIIANTGKDDLEIVTFDEGSVATVAAYEVVELFLYGNGSVGGDWTYRLRTRLTSNACITAKTVWVTGGNPSTATYALNVTSGVWSTGTSVPASKIEAANFALGPFAYFVGDDPAAATNHELSSAGVWVTRASMGFSTLRPSGAACEDSGYIFGGDTNQVGKYSLDTWKTPAALSMATKRSVAVGLGDRILIVAGEPVPMPPQVYLPSADVYWSATDRAGAARHSMAGFANHAGAHVVGGVSPDGTVRYQSTELYSHVSNTWSVLANLGLGTRYRGAGVGSDGVGYYLGGRDSGDAASAAVGTFLAGVWSTGTSLPAAKSEVQGCGASL